MITLLSGLALALAAPRDTLQWSVQDPFFIEGEPYRAELVCEAPADQTLDVLAWHLGASGFSVNGRPLAERDAPEVTLSLDAGSRLVLSVDLAPALSEHEAVARSNFVLSHAAAESEQAIDYLREVEPGIDFMNLPAEQLDDYQVVLETNRGTMRAEFWPDVAPNHVRSFLDLSSSGFYDGTLFHRVIPGFMIQGGQAKPGTQAPRTLQAEFSDRRHVRGVLSMARLGNDINSASSEFFVMHADSPHLDGQYSAFGKLVEGLPAVDLIVESYDKRFRPGDPQGTRPPQPQVLERAIVREAPHEPAK